MKRTALYSFIGLFLIFFFLIITGLVSIRISSVWHYKLNDTEAKLLDDFILRFRQQIESGEFDEIQSELADGIGNKSEVIEKIKKNRRKFGKPIYWQFLNSSPPGDAVKYYPKLNGNQYYTFFSTNTHDGDLIIEQFNWVITSNGEAKLIDYSSRLTEGQENRIREIDHYMKEYRHELIVPFGEREIEIRY